MIVTGLFGSQNRSLPLTDSRFPYYETEPGAYLDLSSTLYRFCIHQSPTVGYIRAWVVQQMPWGHEWLVDHEQKLVSPHLDCVTVESQNSLIRKTLERARDQGSFKVLRGWRNELYPVLGMSGDVVMERSGSALFGINTYGGRLSFRALLG